MKLREVCEFTGISRRNIHFYIKEELLCPAQNPENGYYEFSEEDCKRLLFVRELRNAGFSLAQIRALLKKPSTAVYYLNLRLRDLKKKIRQAEKTAAALTQLEQTLPLHPTLDMLEKLVRAAGIPAPPDTDNTEELAFEESDNTLVNRYLWENFLPEAPFTDYQEYLWSKINRFSSSGYARDYQLLNQTLHSLSDEQIAYAFADTRAIHRRVIDLQPSDYLPYAEDMKNAIRRFIHSPQAVQRWRSSYQKLTAPAARLYDSEIAKTMDELSPLFKAYRTNIHAVCRLVYDWLHSPEGRPLLAEMQRSLGNFFDIEGCSHGELQAMMTF